MSDSPSQRALAASTVCLIISVACVAAFLPPMLERTLESILRTGLDRQPPPADGPDRAAQQPLPHGKMGLKTRDIDER